MRVEHYCHELPEFGITVYGGLAALGSVSTEELDDRMANWRPALMSCDELVGSLGWLDYAPIRMTHSPRNNQLEPYPDLSRLLPYIRPVEERLDADDPVQSDFTLHHQEIFLGERPDWKLVGFQVYPEAIFLLQSDKWCGMVYQTMACHRQRSSTHARTAPHFPPPENRTGN